MNSGTNFDEIPVTRKILFFYRKKRNTEGRYQNDRWFECGHAHFGGSRPLWKEMRRKKRIVMTVAVAIERPNDRFPFSFLSLWFFEMKFWIEKKRKTGKIVVVLLLLFFWFLVTWPWWRWGHGQFHVAPLIRFDFNFFWCDEMLNPVPRNSFWNTTRWRPDEKCFFYIHWFSLLGLILERKHENSY